MKLFKNKYITSEDIIILNKYIFNVITGLEPIDLSSLRITPDRKYYIVSNLLNWETVQSKRKEVNKKLRELFDLKETPRGAVVIVRMKSSKKPEWFRIKISLEHFVSTVILTYDEFVAQPNFNKISVRAKEKVNENINGLRRLLSRGFTHVDLAKFGEEPFLMKLDELASY